MLPLVFSDVLKGKMYFQNRSFSFSKLRNDDIWIPQRESRAVGKRWAGEAGPRGWKGKGGSSWNQTIALFLQKVSSINFEGSLRMTTLGSGLSEQPVCTLIKDFLQEGLKCQVSLFYPVCMLPPFALCYALSLQDMYVESGMIHLKALGCGP